MAAEGTMIASVDGTMWTSKAPVAAIVNGKLIITGTGEDGVRIDLNVNELAKKKFVVDGLLGGSISYNTVVLTPKNANSSDPLYTSAYFQTAGVGEVNIAEIDETGRTITGTVTSKVKRTVPSDVTVEIAKGSFTKVPYDESNGGIPGNTASMKIDGVAFNPTLVGGVVGFGKLTLNMALGDKSIGLTVPATTNTGTFELKTFGEDYTAIYSTNNGTTVYESASGSIVISKHDKTARRIEGTFSFSGQLFPLGGGSLSVTNGVFAITYQ